MKHTELMYQMYYNTRKGFFLMEVILALCILVTTISSIVVYHADIQLLYVAMKKRDEALRITNTVIETLHATRELVRNTSSSDITVLVSPSVNHIAILDESDSESARLAFFDICTTWQLPSGVQASFTCITCIPSGVS